MATKLIQESTLTNIANAIRAKTGKVDTMTPSEMPSEIGSISGGGDSQMADFVANTLTSFYNEDIITVGRGAFRGMSANLVELPNCTSTTVANAFGDNNNIKAFKLPALSSPSYNTFSGAAQLQIADFTALDGLVQHMFYGCSNLKTLIFRKTDGIVTLLNTGVITNSGMGGSDARIYVPQSLITQYQQGTNWSVIYADNNNLFQQLEGSPYENPNYDVATLLAS